MKEYKVPYCTIIISLATFAYSLFVCYEINGAFYGRMKIIQLEEYGGITFEHLKNFEFWRLFASQMIHRGQLHMLYSVLSLLVLGIFIERHVNFVQFFSIWFVPGAIGTLVSTLSVDPPWNLGTGASQATFGVAAFGLVLAVKKIENSWKFYGVLLFSLIPALTLDFIYAGYPKPGHVTGFVVGALLGLTYLKFKRPGELMAGRLRSG
ncbi:MULTISPECIES: rhomboid family intramembrane serine protease [unclassified Microbulbifer]|uniref:rhomboid family intramembrane serine protease n=1 Tax=unclassified Microbulbifer TaxID=2619833 RepID=UPI0027E3B508|nr:MULTISPECIES: rhomboid family intramembrane serine protease [unclassified Microbulbifer]